MYNIPMDENMNLSQNTEIEKALKEFEAKNVSQTTQSSSVQIDTKIPRMNRWVMKLSGGLIKSEKQTNYILVIFSIIVFLVSLFFFFGGNVSVDKSKINQGEILSIPAE
jgi:hypothetical protein